MPQKNANLLLITTGFDLKFEMSLRSYISS